MSFGSFSEIGSDESLAEINMVPLIDVMLVLLVIFIVAAPMLTNAVKVDLPRAAAIPNQPRPDTLQLSIDAAGQVYWNRMVVTQAELSAKLQAAARLQPQPELHLNAERSTPYEKVAEVMSAAARTGLTRIGFVTLPPR
ncbi:MAG: biopolymer transporter ExbD [Sterolibacterium sp.]|jgi:biopolymer transport protein ExbD|nr:biopolymer transporter ExbD [Sterolibacterium sp.]